MAGCMAWGLRSQGLRSSLTNLDALTALVPGYSALYLFNEGGGQVLTDYSGNGYHGTLGSGSGVDAADPWRIPAGVRHVDDWITITPALAGFSGSAACTIQAVTSSETPVALGGILNDGGGGTAARLSVAILDSTNAAGSATADSIYFAVRDGSGNTKSMTIAGRLTNAPTVVTMRFVGGVSLEARKNIDAWTKSTTSVVSTIGPSSIDAGAKLVIGRYVADLYSHIGATSLLVIYPRALTDEELAINQTAIAAIMAARGAPLGTPLPSYQTAVAMGDSITLGVGITGVTAETAYPNVLGLALGYPVVNAGIGGDTTTQMTARLAELLTKYDPDTVMILGGTNDVASAVPAATATANLGTMVSAVTAAGATAVLLTVPPDSAYNAAQNEWLVEVNGWIATQAGEGVLVADIHAALKDPEAPTQLLTAYDSGDHMHPSVAGLAKIAETVHAAIRGA